jgi:hypothetical protein
MQVIKPLVFIQEVRPYVTGLVINQEYQHFLNDTCQLSSLGNE